MAGRLAKAYFTRRQTRFSHAIIIPDKESP